MRFRFFLLLLILAAMIILRPGAPVTKAQAGEAETRWELGPETRYIITWTGEESSCRTLTREEAEYWRQERGRDSLRELRGEGLNRVAEAGQQTGLKIILRGTTQLENNAQAKAAFLRAAAYWEAIIASPITVVLDVDFGPTRFGVPYPSSSVIGSTSTQTLGTGTLYNSLRTQLIDRAVNSQQAQIFSLLPTGSLPTQLGNTTAVYTSSAILRALGFISATADPATEAASYGPPPSIGFNSNFPFDFDPADGIDFDKIDFNATAIHEIGHFLGFSSAVGQSELSPRSFSVSSWDLFRFRPGVSLENFMTEPRLLVSGGEHLHFAGLNTAALSTSRLDGQGGDGRQAPHWKDDSTNGQLIGIMDPTASSGMRDEASAFDLQALGHFGYRLNSNVTVTERLSIDDNGRNAAPAAPGSLVVNRLTPTRYPATVRSVIVNIPLLADQSSPVSPVGASLRLVIFRGATADGQPLPNPQYLFNQPVTIPAITGARFVEFAIDGPTIDAGDFFVGVLTPASPVGIAVDTTGTDPKRSYVSANNGASFQPLNSLVGGTGTANFMARAVVSYSYGATPVPDLSSVSPTILPVGAAEQTVYLTGSNFQPDSVVRFNEADRVTRFVSGSLLQATLSGADLATPRTGTLTVRTPGPAGQPAAVSAGQLVTIGADSPRPALTRLDPSAAPLGATTQVVNLYGTNLTPLSRIRVNGVERPTTYVSPVQLSTLLQPADMAQNSPLALTVTNPAPGGGISNELTLVIAVCNYSLNTFSQSFPAAGGSNGVTLTTNNQVCSWNVTTDSPWVSLLRPATAAGTGKSVVSYSVAPNQTADLRIGRLVIGGQIMLIRQAGVVTTVSAASYGTTMTPDSIVVGFGSGLAKATQAATALPLPTSLQGTTVTVLDAQGSNRSAPLFYVSPQQVNYLLPAGTAIGSATVTISVDGAPVSTGVVAVAAVAPALFSANSSGQGVAAANLIRVRSGGQSFEPVAAYSSGEQRFIPQTIAAGPDGDRLFLALFGTGIRGRSALSAVRVRIGELEITPEYAGAQPDFAGLDQVNFELPRSLKGRGTVTISLVVDGQVSNQVTIVMGE